MPSRQPLIISAASQVLPLTEDSFVIDLKETENNLLGFTLNDSSDSTVDAKDNSSMIIAQIYETITHEETIYIPAAVLEKATLPEISLLEVSQHDSFDDCWLVIYDRVYDVTSFLQSVSDDDDDYQFQCVQVVTWHVSLTVP